MQPKIRIYYHVTQINDYLDITEYIFEKIVRCGLMSACEGVYVCALGNESEFPKLKELINMYPKAQIIDHSENKNLWELFTLQHLKKDADTLPKFYAWYLHSKSVTYSAEDKSEKGIADKKFEIFWRDYMIHEIVTRWEDCYKALDMEEVGYDVAGCRMIPKRLSGSIFSHFSGNMWAANSEYIKTLDPIGENPNVPDMDEKIIEMRKQIEEARKTGEIKMEGNKFGAEHWLWTCQPLTYIACNAHTVGFPSDRLTYEEWLKSEDADKYRTRP